MKKNVIAYYRVSTHHQGISGLGMDAQKAAVQRFLTSGDSRLLAEFSEVETGKRNQRPALDKAIALCRKSQATLLIAKLDRLSRNAAFLLTLQESGINFLCCDMPSADKFTIGILALVAQREAEMTSKRTKEALAAARARGTILGNPRLGKARKLAVQSTKRKAAQFAHRLAPVLEEITAAGVTTLRGIAECLNRRGYTTPMGKAWRRQAVAKLRRRLS